jgi:rod shape-determining protein MreC
MVYLLLAIALMMMDLRGQYADRVRGVLLHAFEPVFFLVDWPSTALRGVQQRFKSFETLLGENQSLSRDLLAQAAAMQRTQALERENQRLRGLLGAITGEVFHYQFAEILQVDLDPFSHRLMIDKGDQDGAFVGQAVIDGAGIVGQIESVQWHMSSVRLISDPDHALPVQSGRTGLRSVAFGTGSTDTLLLPNVPLQADVRVGDLLVTSGLGERFPPGFPVARVESVERTQGETFARVSARPLAALDRGREVLLILSEKIQLHAPEEEKVGTTLPSEPDVPRQPGAEGAP